MSADESSNSSHESAVSSKALMFMIENLLHLDNTTPEQTQSFAVRHNDTPDTDRQRKEVEHLHQKKRLRSESDSEESTFNKEPDRLHKRKKSRTSFTSKQIDDMEKAFSSERYLPATNRKRLARRLELSDQQVKTWFQNRRMKDKRVTNDEPFVQKSDTFLPFSMTSQWSYYTDPRPRESLSLIIADSRLPRQSAFTLMHAGQRPFSTRSDGQNVFSPFIQADLSFTPKISGTELCLRNEPPKTSF